MPGFVIGGLGGNRGGISPGKRYYTSFSWEIDTLSSAMGSDDSQIRNVVALRTATLPQATFDKVSTEGGSVDYKFAGKPKFEDVRISWYDTVDISRYYRRWYELIFDTDSGVKAPNAYKGDAIIRKYLSDRPDFGDTSPLAAGVDSGNTEYKLFGSWPTSFKESELTYLEASIKSIEITITYDYFESEYKND